MTETCYEKLRKSQLELIKLVERTRLSPMRRNTIEMAVAKAKRIRAEVKQQERALNYEAGL